MKTIIYILLLLFIISCNETNEPTLKPMNIPEQKGIVYNDYNVKQMDISVYRPTSKKDTIPNDTIIIYSTLKNMNSELEFYSKCERKTGEYKLNVIAKNSIGKLVYCTRTDFYQDIYYTKIKK